jgi:hypothetical protein
MANLSAVSLQRAAADQIRLVEAHRRPPLRLGVLLHCTPATHTHTKQSATGSSEIHKPTGATFRAGGGEGVASPSVSRSVCRRWRSLSRREFTEAVAAACRSLSSATDAMAGRAPGFVRWWGSTWLWACGGEIQC